MSRVNIPSTIQDPSYRYTMPVMKLKQESRLNGVKTNITNLADVANALRVPDSAIIKYFCAEVGANQEQDTIVKGSHTIDSLAKLLDKFIHKYVLCGKCKYPEVAHNVQKKELVAICNACGHAKKMDIMHKAGKQLFKEIPTYYKNNPEFRGKQSQAQKDVAMMNDAEAQQQTSASGKGKGKSKRQKKADEQAEKVEQEEEVTSEQKQKMKADAVIASGGEIDLLSSVELKLNSDEIEQLLSNVDTMITNNDPTVSQLLEDVRFMQVGLNITANYKFYILMCGIFTPKRNIVKSWTKYEEAFLQLVKDTGALGGEHLFQAIVLYFMRRHTDQQKYLEAFMMLLYNQSIFSDEFFISWHSGKKKLDKNNILCDRKAEKEMKGQITKFIDWLQSEDYGEEYGEEEAAEEVEETKEETPQLSEQQKMIAEQQKAQAEALKTAAEDAEAAEKAAELKRQQEEEAKEQTVTEITDSTKITQIKVEDDFEIDDI